MIVDIPNVGQVNFPDSMSESEVNAAAKRLFDESTAPEVKEGIGTALRRGAEQFVSSGQTALESITKGGEEAAIRAQERQADIQRRLGSGASLERLQQIYKDQGILPAAKELGSQILPTIVEQVPNIGATLGGAAAGAAAGSLAGPVGTVIGGIGGALAPSFVQQYGGNIQRQAEAQTSEGKPLDINRGVAAGTAVPQAGLEVLGTLIPLGGNIVTKILGPTVGKLIGSTGSKIADEALLTTIAKGTAKGIAFEVPTEVTQQILERAQAGLSLTNDDALKEYGQTAFVTSLLGPLGIIGRVSDKAQASRDLALAQQKAAETGEPQQVPLQLTYDPTVSGVGGTVDLTPFTVFPDGRVAPTDEAAFQEQFKRTYPLGSTEAYAIPGDKEAIMAARMEEARKYSPAMQKINAIYDKKQQEVATQQAKVDSLKAQQSAFTNAPMEGGVIRPVSPEVMAAEQAKLASYADTKTLAVMRNNKIDFFEGIINDNGRFSGIDPTTGKKVTFNPNSANVVVNPTERDIVTLENKFLDEDLKAISKEIKDAEKSVAQKATNFEEWIKKNPIKESEVADTLPNALEARAGGKGTKIAAGARKYFSKQGSAVDDLALRAVEDGVMTQEELDSPGYAGGINAFLSKLEAAYNKETIATPENRDALAQIDSLYNQQEQLQAEIDRRQVELNQTEMEPVVSEQQTAPIPEGIPPATIPTAQIPTTAQAEQLAPTSQPSFRAEVPYEFSVQAKRDMAKIIPRLTKALDRMGLQNIGLNLAKNLKANIDGKITKVNGTYLNRIITLCLDNRGIEATLHHEVIHALKEMGMFSQKEWATLSKIAKDKWIDQYNIDARYPNASEEVKIEEAIASAFPDYMKQVGQPRGLLQRIKDFMQKVGNVFRGLGYNSPESVFAKTESGKLSGKSAANVGQLRASVSNRDNKYVTVDEIYKMQRDAYKELSQTKEFKQSQKRIDDARNEYIDRFNAVKAEAVRLLKENPEFNKIAEVLSDKKIIDRVAMDAFQKQAEANVPLPKVSEGQMIAEQNKLIQSYFNSKGIPEPREFSEFANQQRSYYSDPKFKKWFGASKVVDKDGQPLVAFHSTDKDFSEFNVGKAATNRSNNPDYTGQLGSWFTAPSLYDREYETGNAENAVTFSEGKEGDNMMPVHLSIKNPKEYEGFEDLQDDRDSYKSIKEYRDSLVDKGYDGVVVRNSTTDGNVDRDDWVAFEPTQIKSAIGNNGEFDATNPDIRAEVPSRDKFKAPMQGVDPAYAEMLRQQFTQEQATVKERMEGLKANFFERMMIGVFDEFRTIKKYDPTAYMMARLSKSIDGGLQGLLEHGQVSLRDGALDIRPNTKGLLKILEPVGSEVDQYQSWKALSRDANLPVDKRSFPADLVAGRNQLVQGTLNGQSRKAVYEKALREENELNKSVLQVALDTGLIDKQGYDNFANDIYYIPFYKMMEDGDVQSVSAAAKLTGQQFSKTLKGGEKKVNDLMENVLLNWSHILSAAMKNQAAVKTIDAAQKMGAAQAVNAMDGKYPKDSVKVMKDGKVIHYELSDPDLVDAISTISYLGPKSQFLDIARGFTNALRYGITMSPAYKVRNLIRDSIQSAAISELGPNMFSNVYNGLAMSKDGNPTFMSALAGGGIFEMGTAHEGNQAKLIKRLIDKGVNANHILDTTDKIKGKLQDALNWYNEQGNKFENANRLALYQKLIDSGKSHLEASYAARDLMDFSMQGQFRAIKIVGSVVPFFNARLQGLYKLGRDGITPFSRVIYNATTGKPIDVSDKQKAMRFATISGAVMLTSLALYDMYKDDEDFKRREDWDRDNFWWFKIGDTAYRIPKPFEIGALGTIAERTYEQIADEGVEGKVFADRMNRILMDTLSLNPTPQMIKPLIDLYANKDSFTGAPIESAGMQNLSKQERVNNNTSGVAIALGGITSGAAKILTFNPQAQGFSPVQIDYSIKAYLGWLGATAASTADLAVEPFSEGTKVRKPVIDTLAMGFIKTEPEIQSKYMTQFYQNNANLQSALADMRHYAELGDSEKVQKIMEEKGNDIALAKVYDKTSKQLATLRQQSRLIENNKTIPAEERRAEMVRLKILMSTLAEQAESMRKQLNK